jgi:hypothetical protein
MGSMAGAFLIITFFVRVFPVISIYKILEDRHELNKQNDTIDEHQTAQAV